MSQQNQTELGAPPSIAEVSGEAFCTVTKIMEAGSDKSVFGQWFYTDSIRYNADRAIAHICQSLMQLDGSRPDPDALGESGIAHMERALVRCAFLLFKMKRGKTK